MVKLFFFKICYTTLHQHRTGFHSLGPLEREQKKTNKKDESSFRFQWKKCDFFFSAQTDDWNPRSLSSFQTFPRNASPPGSASPASEQRSSTSSSASSTSSTASSSHFNGHDINGGPCSISFYFYRVLAVDSQLLNDGSFFGWIFLWFVFFWKLLDRVFFSWLRPVTIGWNSTFSGRRRRWNRKYAGATQ